MVEALAALPLILLVCFYPHCSLLWLSVSCFLLSLSLTSFLFLSLYVSFGTAVGSFELAELEFWVAYTVSDRSSVHPDVLRQATSVPLATWSVRLHHTREFPCVFGAGLERTPALCAVSLTRTSAWGYV